MLFAGHETTVNLIAHSVLSLLRHPPTSSRKAAPPTGADRARGIRGAAAARVVGPALAHPARPSRTSRLPAPPSRAGSPIFLCYGSANRDPRSGSRTPTDSTSNARTTSTSATARASTTASAPRSPGWRPSSRSSEFFRRVENPRLVEDPPPYRRNQIFRGPRRLLVDIDGVRD